MKAVVVNGTVEMRCRVIGWVGYLALKLRTTASDFNLEEIVVRSIIRQIGSKWERTCMKRECRIR